MKDKPKPKPGPKKGIPYWRALLIGMVVTAIVANAIFLTLQIVSDNSMWATLKRPPSDAIRIINAIDYDVWIETSSGDVFTTTVQYCNHGELCHEWSEVEDVSKIPAERKPSRGKTCNELRRGMFPLNPIGKVVECVYSDSDLMYTQDEGYFALMADGSVKYQYYGYFERAMSKGVFNFSTYFLPLCAAVLISLVYSIKYFVKRIRKNKKAIPG